MTSNVLNNERNYDARTRRIINGVIRYHPDVICFQELRIDGMRGLESHLASKGFKLYNRSIIKNNPVDTVGIAVKSNSSAMRVEMPVESESIALTMRVYGKSVGIASYHGYWGATGQAERYHETSSFGSLFDADVQVVAGDYNAVTEESAIRVMRGFESGESGWSYWMDAQSVMNGLHGGRELPTTYSTGLGASTAAEHGIHAGLMPERCIDHIMSRGFNYGKAGGYCGFEIIDWLDSSNGHVQLDSLTDHRILLADIII